VYIRKTCGYTIASGKAITTQPDRQNGLFLKLCVLVIA
jgi:hypothetical protein